MRVLVVVVALVALGGCKGETSRQSRESTPKTTCERYRDFARQDDVLGSYTTWSCRDGALNATVELPHSTLNRNPDARVDTRLFVRTFVANKYNPRVDHLRINLQHRSVTTESSVTGKVTRTSGPTYYATYYDPDEDAVGFCGTMVFRNRFTNEEVHVPWRLVGGFRSVREPYTGKPLYEEYRGWPGESGNEPDCHRDWLAKGLGR
jgi:hypothetical protein